MKLFTRNIGILILSAFCMGTAFYCMHAHTTKLRSMNKLYKMVSRGGRPYAVALLYDSCDQDCSQRRSLDALSNVFSSVSSAWLYKAADVQFYKIDVSKEDSNALMTDLAIGVLPVIILFKFGSPVQDESGNTVSLSGFVTSDEIRDFIDDNIGDGLQERAEQKADDRERRAAQASYYWYNYPYCYPYWGGCGWGGCGYYGGCGWGGRCGPRFGVGFCL